MGAFLKTWCLILAFLTLTSFFLLANLPPLQNPLEPCHCSTLPPSLPPPPPLPSEEKPTKLRDGNGEPYLLVVMVLSSPSGKERRDAIRQTWAGGGGGGSILVKFAIGTEGLAVKVSEAIQAEERIHGDLLLLPNLQESYSNLTRKVLTSFVALDERLDFSFLLKCDDDTFVLLDTVATELGQRSHRQRLYWGFFNGRATVKRRGKWEEKGWFLCDRYLPYALGGGYVLSSDLVHRIVVNADFLDLYNSEDVSVGVWLSAYAAERKHDVRFNTEWKSRGCRNAHVVSHKQSVEEMRSRHQMLEERGVQCEKEIQVRASYHYNWTVEPSKCCERQQGII